MRRPLLSLIATAALLSTAAPAFAQATPGATVAGYAFGDFQIGCTTCSHIPIPLSGNPESFVQDPLLAQAAYAGTPMGNAALADYTLAGSVSYAGLATFEGSLWTPLLKAEALADNEQAFIVLDPVVPVGIDLYQASVDAGTLMFYQYTGSAPASYTFHFEVDGRIGNQQALVFASATVYGGPDLDLETGALDFGYAQVDGVGIQNVVQPFLASFDVTAEVAPGDSFWLQASLGVLASMTYSSADVVVDAYDTMRVVAVTGGDTSLLLAQPAAPVPEPAPLLMLAAGLAAIGLRRRSMLAG